MENFCSNIQIYNFKNKLKREEIIEKIANFKNVEKGKINEYVDLIFDETSNFVTMYDKNFKAILEFEAPGFSAGRFSNPETFQAVCRCPAGAQRDGKWRSSRFPVSPPIAHVLW